MSPTMVDFRSPASASSKLQSNRYRSHSSVADRIPSSPSHPIYRSGGIPEPSPTMDRRNLGQGGSLSSSDPFRLPPVSSSSASEKLSIPRFRKHRKHSSTSRTRPAVNAEDSGAGQGFNPLGPETSRDAPLDRAEDSGSQAVREQLHGWKPFAPEASSNSSSGTGFAFVARSSRSLASSSNIASESVKGSTFDIGNNNSESDGSGIFVFGSAIEKSSSLNLSTSQCSSAHSIASADSAKSEGMAMGDSVFSLGVDNVNSDSGSFVFRSSAKKDGNLPHSSSLGSDNISFYKLNSMKLVDEKIGQLDSGFLMHKIGEKKTTHSSKNSSFTFVDDLLHEQTERSWKIDLENSSSVNCQKADRGIFLSGNCSETKSNLDHVSSLHSDECSIFSSFKLPEELGKLKIETSRKGENSSKDSGVFIFESGMNKSTCASNNSSFGAFDSSISKLPKKMEELNLFSSACEVHHDTTLKQAHAQFVQTSTGFDEGVSSKFFGELKNQNVQSSGIEEHENDNPGVFVFGSDVRRKANSGKSYSFNFDESLISKLPDEIGKMKLSTGKEDDFKKSKPGNTCSQHDNNSSSVSSHFTSQTAKEDYSSSVSPLQAYNSYGSSAETTYSPSPVPCFQSSGADFYFTSLHTGSEKQKMEFISQKQDTSMLNKDNLFTGSYKNITSGLNKEDIKGLRLKSKRGKSRQSTPIHSGTAKQFVHEDKGLEKNQEQDSTGGYSPMDYSPYQETLVSNQCSREESVASDESIHLESRCTSNDIPISGSANAKEGELFSGSAYGKEGGLLSTAEHFGANEGLLDNETSDCGLIFPSSSHFTSEYSRADEMIPGLRKENLAAENETFGPGILNKSSSIESESFSYDSTIKQTTYEGSNGFNFTSNLEDTAQYNFCFTTKSSDQGPSSASRRICRRKSRVVGGQDSHPSIKAPLASPSNLFLFQDVHVPTSPIQQQKGFTDGKLSGKVNGAKTIEESAKATTSVKAEDDCEKWRLRGNQAYADGNLSKAEDYYSRGVDSFPPNEDSKRCSRALMLCYSNRAATRMSLGRLRDALSDCKAAVAIDPSFLRAQVRAGNILLSLGEPTDALQHFEKVLQLDNEAKSDQKILLEAVDGLEKTQKLNGLMDRSSILLKKRTPDDATKALEIISEALFFSPYSEILLEMKSEALVMLRSFEEAIQICEQTLEFAEKNAVTDSCCQLKDDDYSKSLETSNTNLWRWRIISKSYFYLGKLEEANELLQKHENVKPVIDKYWSRHPESSTSFSVIVCELLRLKTAGNEAFQAGKHLEAVEFYTAALALNTESRPFTAICFCNRAAAYQALGQITDAVADCSLAIALDSSYRKAISRRATLHEMIRDYGQAATDLQNLISLLEMSSEDKGSASGKLGRSSNNTSDLNQARMRLGAVEEEARKEGSLDLYMILGIERSCSAADVRKAYRKAALRHHPDKAGQILARSENGDDRVWREVAEEVHTNADRLFKMIGEAYTILVNPSKRLQYDDEVQLKMKNSSPHNSQFERSAEPRHSRSYGNTHRRWSESSWSNW